MGDEEKRLAVPEIPRQEIAPSIEDAPEQVEVKPENEQQKTQESGKQAETAEQSARKVVRPQDQQTFEKDEVLTDVETILSENLESIFASLPEDRKMLFKQTGEETAQRIRDMVSKGKIKISKILGWIRDWLKIIPGVNRYFIDQEAKIKADRLVRYAQENKDKINTHL